MNFGHFTEHDGITGSIDLFEEPFFTITVKHPDGRELKESFHWSFEPRFGIDVFDLNRAESIADKFIKKLRSNE